MAVLKNNSTTIEGNLIITNNYNGSITIGKLKLDDIYSKDLIGMITWFPSQNIDGWLLCDGSTINKTTNPEYTDLIEFLAGAGAESAILPAIFDNDKGRYIKAIQSGETAGDFYSDNVAHHIHPVNISNVSPGSHVHNLCESYACHNHNLSSNASINLNHNHTMCCNSHRHSMKLYSYVYCGYNPWSGVISYEAWHCLSTASNTHNHGGVTGSSGSHQHIICNSDHNHCLLEGGSHTHFFSSTTTTNGQDTNEIFAIMLYPMIKY